MSCWHRYSIRCRLAVVAGLVTGLLCTAMAVFIVVMSRQAVVDFRTDQLFSGAVSLGAQLRHRVPDLTEIGPGQAIQVFDPAGTMVAATRDLAGQPPMTNLRPDPDAYATTTSCDTRVFPDRCMIVLAYPFHREDGVWQLNTAVPDVPWYVGPELIIPLATGCVLLVAAAAAGSYRIVGKTLQPVDAIGGNLAQITASGDLRHRVPVPKYRDELRGLAETANQALERAQMAVDQQLRFASDASHDLRSPLTAMRIRIEEALIDPRQADWQRTADALLDSVERMQALIGDLLQEARLDAGVTGRHEPIDFTELVAGELERRIAKTDLRHRLTPGVMVDGSRIELSRLLNNLLDNAERHADSAVTVTLTLDGGVVTLEGAMTVKGSLPSTGRSSSSASPALKPPAPAIPAAPGSGCRSPGRSPNPTAGP